MLKQETMSFPGWDMQADRVCMKILTNISRFLLALIFTIFGLNGFLHFIPMPPPTGVAAQFMGAMFVSKYLLFVFASQLIAGVLLFVKRYVPLALTLLAPVIVNILLFHSLMAPRDRKSTRLNSSHSQISYAVFCLKKKNNKKRPQAEVRNHQRLRRHLRRPRRQCILTQDQASSTHTALRPASLHRSASRTQHLCTL